MSKFKNPNADLNSMVVKQLARVFLIRAINRKFSGSHFKPHIFTMPGDSLSLEADLCIDRGKRFWLEGVERDATIFKSAKAKLKRDGIKMALHHQDAEDFWKNTKNVFDFVWLDYCGPWCPADQRTFQSIFERKRLRFQPDSNPLIGLTVCEGRDFWVLGNLALLIKPFHRRSGQSRNFLARVGGIPLFLNNMANAHGMTLEPTFMFRYRDRMRRNNAGMILMCLFEVHPKVFDIDVFRTPSGDMLYDESLAVNRNNI